jgi:hypothetical protein
MELLRFLNDEYGTTQLSKRKSMFNSKNICDSWMEIGLRENVLRCLSYYLASFFDFEGLAFLSALQESLIQCLYPAINVN